MPMGTFCRRFLEYFTSRICGRNYPSLENKQMLTAQRQQHKDQAGSQHSNRVVIKPLSSQGQGVCVYYACGQVLLFFSATLPCPLAMTLGALSFSG